MNDQVINIMAYVVLAIIMLGALLFCGYLIYAQIRTEELKNNYIKSLNEHDKSVIATYKATEYKLLERRKKNDRI